MKKMNRKQKGGSDKEASLEREGDYKAEDSSKSDSTLGLRKKVRAHGVNSRSKVYENWRKFEDLSGNFTSPVMTDVQTPYDEHQTGIKVLSDKKPGQFQLAENISVLKIIQSPYASLRNFNLSRVLCAGKETIWISGNDKNVCQINFEGAILDGLKFQVENEVNVLCLNLQQQLIFSLSKFCPDIFKFDGKKVSKIKNLYPWNSKGLCYTKKGDLLVSMRSEDGAKVVRYVETSENNFKETRVIQNDQHGDPLFSKGIDMLFLAENGNTDICVADHAGEKVLVFNSTGYLRFIYKGNVTNTAENRSFRPNQIATDDNFQILISDFFKNIVHVIDQNSSLVCYINHKCSGGLSIDLDHNLLVGDYSTGEIKVIKYLEN